MKTMFIIVVSNFLCAAGCSQSDASSETDSQKVVGGLCEDCAALWEYRNKALATVDTLPDFREPGPKLEVSGTIYHRDGTTPAKDVILYIYHTDQEGEYSRKGSETGWAKRHGYIRGWIRTKADGRYKFYTLKPGAYPGGGNPAHIHVVVKEPGVKEYWIDEYLFDDDPYLTERIRQDQHGRGGNGILETRERNGLLIAERDIILGRNVPGYE